MSSTQQKLSLEEACSRLKDNDYELTELDLSDVPIGDQGAIAIAFALKKNDCLEMLHLGNCRIGESGAAKLAQMLKVNTTLTKLFLQTNNIGDKGCEALAQHGLKHNKTLRTLNLARNHVGDIGAAAIAEVLAIDNPTTLHKLYIYENQIGNYGAAALAEMVLQNTTLQELFMWENKVHDEGFDDLRYAYEQSINAPNRDRKRPKIQIRTHWKQLAVGVPVGGSSNASSSSRTGSNSANNKTAAAPKRAKVSNEKLFEIIAQRATAIDHPQQEQEQQQEQQQQGTETGTTNAAESTANNNSNFDGNNDSISNFKDLMKKAQSIESGGGGDSAMNKSSSHIMKHHQQQSARSTRQQPTAVVEPSTPKSAAEKGRIGATAGGSNFKELMAKAHAIESSGTPKTGPKEKVAAANGGGGSSKSGGSFQQLVAKAQSLESTGGGGDGGSTHSSSNRNKGSKQQHIAAPASAREPSSTHTTSAKKEMIQPVSGFKDLMAKAQSIESGSGKGNVSGDKERTKPKPKVGKLPSSKEKEEDVTAPPPDDDHSAAAACGDGADSEPAGEGGISFKELMAKAQAIETSSHHQDKKEPPTKPEPKKKNEAFQQAMSKAFTLQSPKDEATNAGRAIGSPQAKRSAQDNTGGGKTPPPPVPELPPTVRDDSGDSGGTFKDLMAKAHALESGDAEAKKKSTKDKPLVRPLTKSDAFKEAMSKAHSLEKPLPPKANTKEGEKIPHGNNPNAGESDQDEEILADESLSAEESKPSPPLSTSQKKKKNEAFQESMAKALALESGGPKTDISKSRPLAGPLTKNEASQEAKVKAKSTAVPGSEVADDETDTTSDTAHHERREIMKEDNAIHKVGVDAGPSLTAPVTKKKNKVFQELMAKAQALESGDKKPEAKNKPAVRPSAKNQASAEAATIAHPTAEKPDSKDGADAKISAPNIIQQEGSNRLQDTAEAAKAEHVGRSSIPPPQIVKKKNEAFKELMAKAHALESGGHKNDASNNRPTARPLTKNDAFREAKVKAQSIAKSGAEAAAADANTHTPDAGNNPLDDQPEMQEEKAGLVVGPSHTAPITKKKNKVFQELMTKAQALESSNKNAESKTKPAMRSLAKNQASGKDVITAHPAAKPISKDAPAVTQVAPSYVSDSPNESEGQERSYGQHVTAEAAETECVGSSSAPPPQIAKKKNEAFEELLAKAHALETGGTGSQKDAQSKQLERPLTKNEAFKEAMAKAKSVGSPSSAAHKTTAATTLDHISSDTLQRSETTSHKITSQGFKDALAKAHDLSTSSRGSKLEPQHGVHKEKGERPTESHEKCTKLFDGDKAVDAEPNASEKIQKGEPGSSREVQQAKEQIKSDFASTPEPKDQTITESQVAKTQEKAATESSDSTCSIRNRFAELRRLAEMNPRDRSSMSKSSAKEKVSKDDHTSQTNTISSNSGSGSDSLEEADKISGETQGNVDARVTNRAKEMEGKIIPAQKEKIWKKSSEMDACEKGVQARASFLEKDIEHAHKSKVWKKSRELDATNKGVGARAKALEKDIHHTHEQKINFFTRKKAEYNNTDTENAE